MIDFTSCGTPGVGALPSWHPTNPHKATTTNLLRYRVMGASWCKGQTAGDA
jgi:hypothetical protein